MKWNNLDVTPPDEYVEVKDKFGNIAMALPTYYPFHVVKKSEKKWDSEIIPCEPYWDGGWMIQCEGLENKLKGEVVSWRKIN